MKIQKIAFLLVLMNLLLSTHTLACSQTNGSAIQSILASENRILFSKILNKYKSYEKLKRLPQLKKKWLQDYRALVVLSNKINPQKPCIAFELSSKIGTGCRVETTQAPIQYISRYVCENYL